jgi:hypothetical protein
MSTPTPTPTRVLRTYARSLTLVPIALLLQIGAAAAASPTEDFVAPQRALLAGKPTRTETVSSTQSAKRDAGAATSGGDAQEQAMRLLLSVPIRSASATRSDRPRAAANPSAGDAQVLAQHILLGRRDASVTGS